VIIVRGSQIFGHEKSPCRGFFQEKSAGLRFSLKRQLDAPAGAVIGAPGKTERCGSNSTCVLLDSAKKACLRQACTLQGRRRGGLTARTAHTARKKEQRRMVPRARCWRVHSALTHKVNAIEAINDRLHAAYEGIQSGQLPVLGSVVVATVSITATAATAAATIARA
jgi:hypothetical protein